MKITNNYQLQINLSQALMSRLTNLLTQAIRFWKGVTADEMNDWFTIFKIERVLHTNVKKVSIFSYSDRKRYW